jgi:predicted transposase/invertase (TIGR01784 family)
MYYEPLAARSRYFKESEGGQQTMCKIWEEVRNEGIEQGIEQGMTQSKMEAAKNLINMGILTYEQIAQAQGLPIETVKSLAKEVKGA